MYSVRLFSEDYNFTMDFDNGFLVDVQDLNGIDVNINTSQGTNAIGETVTDLTVNGTTRTIKGYALNKYNANLLISNLKPLSSGTMEIKTVKADFVVKKSPVITKLKDGRYQFVTQLYFADPLFYVDTDYDLSTATGIDNLGDYEADFELFIKNTDNIAHLTPYTMNLTNEEDETDVHTFSIHAFQLKENEALKVYKKNGRLNIVVGTMLNDKFVEKTKRISLLDLFSTNMYFIPKGFYLLDATKLVGFEAILTVKERFSGVVV